MKRETEPYLLARNVIKRALDLTRHLSHARGVVPDQSWMPDGEALAGRNRNRNPLATENRLEVAAGLLRLPLLRRWEDEAIQF